MTDLHVPEYGRPPHAPTQDAYDAACRALKGAQDSALAAAEDLAELKDKLLALAAVEEYIGESCGNASHNIRALLAGDSDPREDAKHFGLEY